MSRFEKPTGEKEKEKDGRGRRGEGKTKNEGERRNGIQQTICLELFEEMFAYHA